ncbi:hypothetical protein FRC02_003889 [Tulasnella sp. 418]|nr:hypothetical protein FRC02_003889 [Tulasnella sp. 418]
MPIIIDPATSRQHMEGFHVVGIFLSVAVFGLYTCLFAQTLYQLKRATSRPVMLFISLTAFWAITTFITVLRAACLYAAAVSWDGVTTVNQYYALWCHRKEAVATMAVIHTTCLLGNLFICWRLYVLWKRDRGILVAPIMLLTCFAATATTSIVYAVKSRKSKRFIPYRDSWQLGTAIGALTVNAVLVGCMCWRIWRVSRSVSHISPITSSFYQRALHTLIESGAGYFVIVFITIVTKVADLPGVNIVLVHLLPQAFSLLPTLVILRLYSSASVSKGAVGHDTIPPTSQRITISQPVFAPASTYTTMIQLSVLEQSRQSKHTSAVESWDHSQSTENRGLPDR